MSWTSSSPSREAGPAASGLSARRSFSAAGMAPPPPPPPRSVVLSTANLSTALNVLNDLSENLPDFGGTKLVLGIAKALLDNIRLVKDNRGICRQLARQIRAILPILTSLDSSLARLPPAQQSIIVEGLNHLKDSFEEVSQIVTQLQSRRGNRIARACKEFLSAAKVAEIFQGCQQDMETTKSTVMLALSTVSLERDLQAGSPMPPATASSPDLGASAPRPPSFQDLPEDEVAEVSEPPNSLASIEMDQQIERICAHILKGNFRAANAICKSIEKTATKAQHDAIIGSAYYLHAISKGLQMKSTKTLTVLTGTIRSKSLKDKVNKHKESQRLKPLEFLESAYNHGFVDYQTLETEPAFYYVRQFPHFKSIQDRMEAAYKRRYFYEDILPESVVKYYSRVFDSYDAVGNLEMDAKTWIKMATREGFGASVSASELGEIHSLFDWDARGSFTLDEFLNLIAASSPFLRPPQNWPRVFSLAHAFDTVRTFHATPSKNTLALSGSRGASQCSVPMSMPEADGTVTPSSYAEFRIQFPISTNVCIGAAPATFDPSCQDWVGCLSSTFALHSQDGLVYCGSSKKGYCLAGTTAANFSESDVIGCGLDSRGYLFWTMNGVYLGSPPAHYARVCQSTPKLYLTVSFGTGPRGALMSANWQGPFLFNLQAPRPSPCSLPVFSFEFPDVPDPDVFLPQQSSKHSAQVLLSSSSSPTQHRPTGASQPKAPAVAPGMLKSNSFAMAPDTTPLASPHSHSQSGPPGYFPPSPTYHQPYQSPYHSPYPPAHQPPYQPPSQPPYQPPSHPPSHPSPPSSSSQPLHAAASLAFQPLVNNFSSALSGALQGPSAPPPAASPSPPPPHYQTPRLVSCWKCAQTISTVYQRVACPRCRSIVELR